MKPSVGSVPRSSSEVLLKTALLPEIKIFAICKERRDTLYETLYIMLELQNENI